MAESEQLWILAGLAAVAFVLAMVVRGLVRGRPVPLPAEGPLRVLVRPLVELRSDPEHLYLGNTISREIASRLKTFERHEPALGDTTASLAIEGTVQKTGPRIVLAVRLLSGRHVLWSGTHDGAMNDLPRMQADITANVARALDVRARKVQPPDAAAAT